MAANSSSAVFLSYAREDADAARYISDALRTSGVEVWFDQSELRGGDAWDQKIRRQIAECALFVPLISANTQTRPKGYFRLEWRLAVEQTHLMADGAAFLVPLVIDDTPERGAVVPPEFLRVHWTRLPAGQPTPVFVEQIKRLLGAAHGAADIGVFRRISTRPAAASASPPCAAARTRRIVGRDKERAELHAAFAAAANGQGLLLAVSGEPGIGKTTLVEDFLGELGAVENACVIARGRCSERLAGTEAYLPILEALGSLLADERHDGAAVTLRRLAPTWFVQVAPLSTDNPLDARLIADAKSGSQERLKRELGVFFQTLSVIRPVVLFFDDLHWADVSTVDLLAYLATKFEGARLLVVATYRPSDLQLAKHPLLAVKADWQARGLSRELTLDFLSRPEIERYLALEFPVHRFPPELSALIQAKTEGSPLFMVDLVRYLKNRKVIALADGTWVLAQSLPAIERDLPESVRGMIDRKMAQLSDDEKQLLTTASVQGFEFDSAVVARVVEISAEDVEQRLERLERVHAFVRRIDEKDFPDRTLTLRYRFVHVLYQNACFGSLVPTRRMALSAAVAQALLAFHGDQAAQVASDLAAHFSAARDYARAVEFYLLAARQAAEVYANTEAAVLAGRGLEMLKSLPAGPERASQELALHLTRGSALSIAHGYSSPDVGTSYARARQLCEAMGDAPESFPVIFGLCLYYWIRCEQESARQIGEQLVRMAGKHDDRVMLTAAHMMLGNVLVHMGKFVSGREHLERSISFYDESQHQSYRSLLRLDPGIYSVAQLARVSCLLGNSDYSRRRFQQASALARKSGDPRSIAYVQVLGTILHTALRECAEVRRLMESCITHCAAHDIGDDSAWTCCWGGWAMAELGAVEDGIALMRKHMAGRRQLGAMAAHTEFLTLLGQSLGKAGRIEEALAAVTDAIALASQMGEEHYRAEMRRIKGELLLQSNAANRDAEAEACFQEALTMAREQSARLWELRAAVSLARLWQQQGKRDAAHAQLAPVYGGFTEGFDTADLKEAKQLLEQLAGTS